MIASSFIHWQELVPLADDALAHHDIAAVNLLTALELPGMAGIENERCRAVVDSWAQHVGNETDRSTAQFQREPRQFENSWAYFRVLVLATVLQQDCGVRYDPDLVDRADFFDNPENLFVHGVLAGKGGTCSSLPPLYVAVGRRLGYPLKLVQTNSHLFARWDDAETGERFNIECTSHGLNCHSDDYYRNWPRSTTATEIEHNGWLVSLTPREELGSFLANRGHCWLANERFREACDAYAHAHLLAPRQAGHAYCLYAALDQWDKRLEQAAPPGFPRLTVHLPRRRFPSVPRALEAAMVTLEVMEDLLENPVHCRDWWEPLRQSPNDRPAHMPAHITVHDPAAVRTVPTHLN